MNIYSRTRAVTEVTLAIVTHLAAVSSSEVRLFAMGDKTMNGFFRRVSPAIGMNRNVFLHRQDSYLIWIRMMYNLMITFPT